MIGRRAAQIWPARLLRIVRHFICAHTDRVVPVIVKKGGNMKRLESKGRQAGQGMTEYIVVVALVAVAAIAVYQTFGQVVRSQTAAMAKELAGEDGTAESQMAQTAAQAAAAQTAAKTLKSFTGNAGAGQ